MPTSKDLLEMANTEWKNREERKGIHDKVSWMSGWISGYLTRNPQQSIMEIWVDKRVSYTTEGEGMNQYRCETCKRILCFIHPDNPGSINEDTGDIYGHFYWYYSIIDKKGCASHSDFNPQAEREFTIRFLEAKLKQMRNLDYTDMYPVNECLINWIRGLREGKGGEP